MNGKYNPVTDTVEPFTSDMNVYDFFPSKGFFFSEEFLTRYYLSLKTKPFVILSGISGTGKTKIAQIFAEYMCQGNVEIERKKRVAFISVRPDWMDNKGLLGYYNILDEKYHTTRLLDLLLDAGEEPDKPFFVILDEMNLAKVEYYFSDFLSILESRTPNNLKGEAISLHPLAEVQTVSGRTIPGSINIPTNVFFTGTVNVDESTYMFSPKVLDRANVIEFNDVDLAAYSGRAVDQPGHFSLLNGNVLDNFYNNDSELRFCRKEDYLSLVDQAKKYLVDLQKILKNYNLQFGYRVANELARFVNVSLTEVGDSCIDEAIDIQILQKILPKLHGTRAKLEEPLQELLAYAYDQSSQVSDELAKKARSYDPAARFPRSARKVAQMLHQLAIQGYVSFIE